MKIAVLRGGQGSQYDTSLQAGEFVLAHLRNSPEKYDPLDIFVSRDGDWHLAGRKLAPHVAVKGTDLVWNALQADNGDRAEVTKLLNNLHIPHTGSSSLGLALSMNQDMSRRAFALHDMPTPKFEVLDGQVAIDDLLRIFRTYLHPVEVRPARGNGLKSVVANNFDELKESVAKAFSFAERVIVSESIRGKNAVCAVIENLRDQKLYSLLPTPNHFKPEEHKMMEHMARRAHEILGLRHYSASSFVVTPKGKIYILETNALPDITKNSTFSKSLSSVGLNPKTFIEHIISIAK